MQKRITTTVRLLFLSFIVSLSLIFSGCDGNDGVVDEGIGVEEGVGEEGLGEEELGEEGLGEEED